MSNLLVLGSVTACFLLIYISISAYLFLRLFARARLLEASTRDLDYLSLSNLIGDVAALKETVKKTNGRISGMQTPKYNLEEEMAKAFNSQQNNVRNIGG